jgi:hypothetical protein
MRIVTSLWIVAVAVVVPPCYANSYVTHMVYPEARATTIKLL